MTRRDDAHRVAEALGTLLLRAHRAHLHATLVGDDRDLDEATYPVLSALARVGPCTATQLAEQVGLDRTVTTRHATRLERASLVARRPDPHDARATTLELTARGRASVVAARARLDDLLADLMRDWPAGRTASFAIDLTALVDGLTTRASDPA